MRRLVLDGLAEHWGALDPTKNPDLDDLQRSYLDRGDDVLVAVAEDRIVASGVLLAESPSVGRIVRMSVDATVRRHGIGRTMVAQLLDRARARGFREVLIETNHDWEPAVTLYQHCGFAEYDRDEESVHLRLTVASPQVQDD